MQMLHDSPVAERPILIAGYGAASRRATLIVVSAFAVMAMILVWILSAVTGG